MCSTIDQYTLIKNALIKASELKFDVFNMLDMMGNDAIFERLKFGEGTGGLNYYMYN